MSGTDNNTYHLRPRPQDPPPQQPLPQQPPPQQPPPPQLPQQNEQQTPLQTPPTTAASAIAVGSTPASPPILRPPRQEQSRIQYLTEFRNQIDTLAQTTPAAPRTTRTAPPQTTPGSTPPVTADQLSALQKTIDACIRSQAESKRQQDELKEIVQQALTPKPKVSLRNPDPMASNSAQREATLLDVMTACTRAGIADVAPLVRFHMQKESSPMQCMLQWFDTNTNSELADQLTKAYAALIADGFTDPVRSTTPSPVTTSTPLVNRSTAHTASPAAAAAASATSPEPPPTPNLGLTLSSTSSTTCDMVRVKAFADHFMHCVLAPPPDDLSPKDACLTFAKEVEGIYRDRIMPHASPAELPFIETDIMTRLATRTNNHPSDVWAELTDWTSRTIGNFVRLLRERHFTAELPAITMKELLELLPEASTVTNFDKLRIDLRRLTSKYHLPTLLDENPESSGSAKVLCAMFESHLINNPLVGPALKKQWMKNPDVRSIDSMVRDANAVDKMQTSSASTKPKQPGSSNNNNNNNNKTAARTGVARARDSSAPSASSPHESEDDDGSLADDHEDCIARTLVVLQVGIDDKGAALGFPLGDEDNNDARVGIGADLLKDDEGHAIKIALGDIIDAKVRTSRATGKAWAVEAQLVRRESPTGSDVEDGFTKVVSKKKAGSGKQARSTPTAPSPAKVTIVTRAAKKPVGRLLLDSEPTPVSNPPSTEAPKTATAASAPAIKVEPKTLASSKQAKSPVHDTTVKLPIVSMTTYHLTVGDSKTPVAVQLDTGNECSALISPSMTHLLDSLSREPTSTCVDSADGSRINIQGHGYLTLNLDTKHSVEIHVMVVQGSPEALVLGLPALHAIAAKFGKKKLRLNLQTGTVSFGRLTLRPGAPLAVTVDAARNSGARSPAAQSTKTTDVSTSPTTAVPTTVITSPVVVETSVSSVSLVSPVPPVPSASAGRPVPSTTDVVPERPAAAVETRPPPVAVSTADGSRSTPSATAAQAPTPPQPPVVVPESRQVPLHIPQQQQQPQQQFRPYRQPSRFNAPVMQPPPPDWLTAPVHQQLAALQPWSSMTMPPPPSMLMSNGAVEQLKMQLVQQQQQAQFWATTAMQQQQQLHHMWSCQMDTTPYVDFRC